MSSRGSSLKWEKTSRDGVREIRIVSETRTGSCGVCYTCQSGYPQVCEQKRAYGIGVNGAFSKYVVGPARLLHRLPDNIAFETAAVIEPAAICGLGAPGAVQSHGRRRRPDHRPGTDRAHLPDAGKGKRREDGRDYRRTSAEEIRFKKAVELGADFIINTDKEDPVQTVLHRTQGLGVDILVETSGGEKAISQAFEMVRRLGRVCAWGYRGNLTSRFLMTGVSSKGFATTSVFPAVGHPGRE